MEIYFTECMMATDVYIQKSFCKQCVDISSDIENLDSKYFSKNMKFFIFETNFVRHRFGCIFF